MIKTGCAGFTVAQKKYRSKLSLVEMDKFRDRSPRVSTVERWVQEAPHGFEFVLTAKVFERRSFDRVYQAAHQMKSKTILFEVPANMGPTSDTVGKLQTYFKSLPKNGLTMIWETPHHWPVTLVERLSKSLNLIPSTNPLFRVWPFRTVLHYFRLGRARTMSSVRPLFDEELSKIKRACTNHSGYVIFDNGPYAFDDALRFSTLIKGHSL